jgi:hypothetical protein
MDYYEKLKETESLMVKFNIDNADTLQSIIDNDQDLKREFFKRLNTTDWFDWLNKKEYFAPNLKNIQFDNNGNAKFWNVLDYLERVSEQVKQNPEYEKYGAELINIIDNLVEFSEKKRRINNYHIWWYCTKILNNIPVKIICDNLSVEEFRKWLLTWLENTVGVGLIVEEMGKNLLPKFLAEDLTLKYAETIIDIITDIKKGKKPSESLLFREHAVTKWDSFWVLDALKRNSKLIGDKCSLKDVIFPLSNKLKTSLEYEHKDTYIDMDVKGGFYRIKVARIPILREGLKEEEIGFNEGEYLCIVKKFSSEQIKGIDKENKLWALHNIEPQNAETEFIFTAPNPNIFVSALREKLPQNIDWPSVEEFDKKIKSLFDGLYTDISSIWFRSLAMDRKHTVHEAQEVLTTILRDILLAKCEKKHEEGEKVLQEFLSGKYLFSIFKRFVLFCIDRYWDKYKEYFDKFLALMPDALENSDFEVELYDIFHYHNSKFEESLQIKLKTLIDKVPEYYQKLGKKSVVSWQYKWLSPLRNNPCFSGLYEEVKKELQPKDNKPYQPDRSTFTAGFVGHKSPISKEEILQKPIAELVEYLNKFKGPDDWKGVFENEPDKEGLADTLQVAVKENPKKFTDNIDIFQGLSSLYLCRMFGGLNDAWKTEKELDWKKIFNFLLEYFGKGKDFIINEAVKSQKDTNEGKYIRIIDAVVDLIEEGCKNDERAFPPEHFENVQNIFDLIFPLLKGEKHPDTQGDALTYALNTTLGSTIMSYITFSLRMARATGKQETDWGKNRYNRFFPIGIDAYIWFGCYLPQMKYLDNKYTEGKINEFANKDAGDIGWKNFMEGYLFGGRVYKDVYSLMRRNYLNAMKSNVFGKRIEERLVQHIAIGYLQGYELLQETNTNGEDSLFWKMLMDKETENKHTRWSEIPDFFWSFTEKSFKKDETVKRKPTPEEIKKKIREFWAWTYKNRNLIKTQLGSDYESFLGKMSQLTILLTSIDEINKEWLLLSAPYIDLHHNATFFIEYLTRFDDAKSIKRIGKILLKVLENTTPIYPQEDIELIVQRIYEKGEKSDADAICNTYGRRGIHFLRPIWEKYQRTK